MAFCVLHGIGRDLAREGALLEIRDILPILALIQQGINRDLAGNEVLEIGESVGIL